MRKVLLHFDPEVGRHSCNVTGLVWRDAPQAAGAKIKDRSHAEISFSDTQLYQEIRSITNVGKQISYFLHSSTVAT